MVIDNRDLNELLTKATAGRRSPGKFIVIEGGDFCGKTTFAEQLRRVLSYRDFNATMIDQPGGDTEGQQIRKLVTNTKFDESTRTLLFSANRVHTSNAVVRPLNSVGRHVICTRWRWSSNVYQDNKGTADFIDATLGVCNPDIHVLLECTDEVMQKGFIAKEGFSDMLDQEYTQDYKTIKERYREEYRKHKGVKFKFNYNLGGEPPKDREFIKLFYPLLHFLGYFDLPEVTTTYEDEVDVSASAT